MEKQIKQEDREEFNKNCEMEKQRVATYTENHARKVEELKARLAEVTARAIAAVAQQEAYADWLEAFNAKYSS